MEGEWWSVFRARDMAKALGISDAAASSSLDRLIKNGFLIRTNDTAPYRENGYRGMGYRIDYGAIAQSLISSFTRFRKAAWAGIHRAFKAVTAFIEGTFDDFLASLQEREAEEPATPVVPKPAPVRRDDMRTSDFDAMFTNPQAPQAGKTSGKIRFEQQNIRDRQALFAASGLETVNGDSLGGCSKTLLYGLEKHLKELDKNSIIVGSLPEFRVTTWISNKYFAIKEGGEAAQKAIAIIQKCLAIGQVEMEALYGKAPEPAPVVTDEERKRIEALDLATYVLDHVWTRDDLSDPRFGVDFILYWLPIEVSLGEVFAYYDKHGKPMTRKCPLRGNVLVLRDIDYSGN